MKLKLKDGTLVRITNIAESIDIDANGISRRSIFINVQQDLTLEQMSDIFTSDNVSSMTVDTGYEGEEMSYTSMGQVSINVSFLETGVNRTVSIN